MTTFITNKYYRWYQQICAGWPCAKDRLDDYTERHHIVPKALGGSNAKLVCLSFRKHFLAHWLVTKCTQGHERVKMVAAITRMKDKRKTGKRIVSGWQFAIARMAFVEMNANPEFVAKRDAQLRAQNAHPEFAASAMRH